MPPRRVSRRDAVKAEMKFDLHYFETVDSTNRLAASGRPGDVFVAANQTAGRGRLDHKWHSRAGENLLMSVVLDVAGIAPSEVATFPLVAGLATVKAVDHLAPSAFTACRLKWPNDVYFGSRKICGILCERRGDDIIVGIGLNVRQREFPEELREKATSLIREGIDVTVEAVMEKVLASLSDFYAIWHRGGFAAVYPDFASIDFLKGREVTVMQTDDDASPVRGICGGVTADGSLLVGNTRIYAGEVRW